MIQMSSVSCSLVGGHCAILRQQALHGVHYSPAVAFKLTVCGQLDAFNGNPGTVKSMTSLTSWRDSSIFSLNDMKNQYPAYASIVG